MAAEERRKAENMGPEEKKKQRLEKALELKEKWKTNWRQWRTKMDREHDEYIATELDSPPLSSITSPSLLPTKPLPSNLTSTKLSSTMGVNTNTPCVCISGLKKSKLFWKNSKKLPLGVCD